MALRQALRQRAPTLRPLAAALLECHATVPRRAASSSGSTAAAAEYERLQSELERVKERMATLAADYPEVRSAHAAHDAFPPPKLHHINIVSARGSPELLAFYRDVMRMDEMPVEMFPRTPGATSGGSDVPIHFTTDGAMQMHLATQATPVGGRRSVGRRRSVDDAQRRRTRMNGPDVPNGRTWASRSVAGTRLTRSAWGRCGTSRTGSTAARPPSMRSSGTSTPAASTTRTLARRSRRSGTRSSCAPPPAPRTGTLHARTATNCAS